GPLRGNVLVRYQGTPSRIRDLWSGSAGVRSRHQTASRDRLKRFIAAGCASLLSVATRVHRLTTLKRKPFLDPLQIDASALDFRMVRSVVEISARQLTTPAPIDGKANALDDLIV